MATPTNASTSAQQAPSSKPLVATGDWTKNLVHLAKTAELKYAPNKSIEPGKRTTPINLFSHRKHGLTLQLHTAHILSAHESLEQKNKAIQDLKEQKNKLRIRFPSPPPRFFLEAAIALPPGPLECRSLLLDHLFLFIFMTSQAREREE